MGGAKVVRGKLRWGEWEDLKLDKVRDVGMG